MPLEVDVLTIFPEFFDVPLSVSIPGRARREGRVEVRCTDIREFATDRHRSVDDRPYGGGPGMVFKPEPVFAAVEHVLAARRAPPERTRRIILAPRGPRLEQGRLRELARAEWIVLLCGHYEGFDERIFDGLDFEPLSIGDYVLSGGEIPALVVLDGTIRLLPGALGCAESSRSESFEEGRLDWPQYTRPPEFRGMRVPEVLLSGDHGEVERWRREQALSRTRALRPDLLPRPGEAGAPRPPEGGSHRADDERGRAP